MEVRKYLLNRRLFCHLQTHFSSFPCSAPSFCLTEAHLLMVPLVTSISGKYFQILPENAFISPPFMNSLIKILVWQLFSLNTSYRWGVCSQVWLLFLCSYSALSCLLFSIFFFLFGVLQSRYGFIFFPEVTVFPESVKSHLSSLLENSQPLNRPNSKATFVSSFLTWLLPGFG